jgi:hypothetical protein
MWLRDNSPDPPDEFTMTIYAGLPADEGWVESEATWNSKASGVPWSVPGGGYDTSVSATGTWSGVGPYKSFDVTELVQLMVDNGQSTGTFHVFSDQAVPYGSQARWSTKERMEAHSNWTPAQAPNATVDAAIFGGVITSPQTVATNADVTVNAVTFDSDHKYAVAGTGSVNLQADTGNAAVTVTKGSHEFQAVVNLASNTDVDVAGGASLAFNNALNLGSNTMELIGDGDVNINNVLTTGGGSVVVTAGTLGGGGTVGGSLSNPTGTVAPGNSPGTLIIEGDFSQGVGGTLEIELAGAAEGEFDVLEIAGNASLAGTLDVLLLGGFVPAAGQSFEIITANAITGQFDPENLPDLGTELSLVVDYGATAVTLLVQGGCIPHIGDANNDGAVGIADLSALADNYGATGAEWRQGDFNGDGVVGIADLSALADNYGWTGQPCPPAASAVPEPATVLLLVGGAVAVLNRRRSR